MTPATLFARPYRDWPGFWFARLEEAVAAGDFVAAAEASAELRRLGVAVQYVRPEPPVCVNRKVVASAN